MDCNLDNLSFTDKVKYLAKNINNKERIILSNIIPSIKELKEVPAPVMYVFVKEYHEGYRKGGGIFYRGTGYHDGGTHVSTTRDFPTDWDDETQKANWYKVDATNVEPCWIRLKDNFDDVSVTEYGAFGDSDMQPNGAGGHDDCKAFKQALQNWKVKDQTGIKSSHRVIIVPAGNYNLQVETVYVRKGQHLKGMGDGSSKLVCTTNTNTWNTIRLGGVDHNDGEGFIEDWGGLAPVVSDLFTYGGNDSYWIYAAVAGYSIRNMFMTSYKKAIYAGGGDGKITDCELDQGQIGIVFTGQNILFGDCNIYWNDYAIVAKSAQDAVDIHFNNIIVEYSKGNDIIFPNDSNARKNINFNNVSFVCNAPNDGFTSVSFKSFNSFVNFNGCTWNNTAGLILDATEGSGSSITIQNSKFYGWKTNPAYQQNDMLGIKCGTHNLTLKGNEYKNIKNTQCVEIVGNSSINYTRVNLISEDWRYAGSDIQYFINNSNNDTAVYIDRDGGIPTPDKNWNNELQYNTHFREWDTAKEIETTPNELLLHMPLTNSLDMVVGKGSVIYSRASTATYIGVDGVLRYVAVDEPRFEKDGFLLESSSTNLIEESNTNFYLKRTTIDENSVISPDETQNAHTVTGDGTEGEHYIHKSMNVPDDDTTYTNSVFVKKGTSSIIAYRVYLINGDAVSKYTTYNFDTGATTGDLKATKLANGWVRLSLQITNNSSGNTTLINRVYVDEGVGTSTSTDTLYIFGMQSEAGNMSSYIPTSGTEETRASDFCKIPAEGNTPYYTKDNDQTIFMDLKLNKEVQFGKIFFRFDYPGSETLFRLYRGNGDEVRWQYAIDGDSGSTQVIYHMENDRNRIAKMVKNNYPKSYISGKLLHIAPYANHEHEETATNNYIWLGNGNYTADCHISNLRIYNGAFTDEEMKRL